MGHFDDRNYVIHLKNRWNFIDSRFDEFILGTDYSFSFQEYLDFSKSVTNESNDKAEKVINFFVKYQNGILLPDRFGSYEPIRKLFDTEDLSIPLRCLCSPGGELMFKKNKGKKYMASICNHTHAVFGEEDGSVLRPTVPRPEYLGEMRIWFFKGRRPTTESEITFYKQLFWDMFDIFEGEMGELVDEESGEVLCFYDRVYVLRIKAGWSFTDPRIERFVAERDYDFTSKEYWQLVDGLDYGANEKAVKTIRFLMEYRDEILLPDRFSSYYYRYEPTIPETPDILIKDMSIPQKRIVSFKKNSGRRFDAEIFNRTPNINPPPGDIKRAPLPLSEYPGEIRITFYKDDQPATESELDFYKQLLRDLGEVLDSTDGEVMDGETNEVLCRL